MGSSGQALSTGVNLQNQLINPQLQASQLRALQHQQLQIQQIKQLQAHQQQILESNRTQHPQGQPTGNMIISENDRLLIIEKIIHAMKGASGLGNVSPDQNIRDIAMKFESRAFNSHKNDAQAYLQFIHEQIRKIHESRIGVAATANAQQQAINMQQQKTNGADSGLNLAAMSQQPSLLSHQQYQQQVAGQLQLKLSNHQANSNISSVANPANNPPIQQTQLAHLVNLAAANPQHAQMLLKTAQDNGFSRDQLLLLQNQIQSRINAQLSGNTGSSGSGSGNTVFGTILHQKQQQEQQQQQQYQMHQFQQLQQMHALHQQQIQKQQMATAHQVDAAASASGNPASPAGSAIVAASAVAATTRRPSAMVVGGSMSPTSIAATNSPLLTKEEDVVGAGSDSADGGDEDGDRNRSTVGGKDSVDNNVGIIQPPIASVTRRTAAVASNPSGSAVLEGSDDVSSSSLTAGLDNGAVGPEQHQSIRSGSSGSDVSMNALGGTVAGGRIKMPPIDLTDEQKDSVRQRMAGMQRLYDQIEVVSQTLLRYRGERENVKVAKLNGMKQMMKVQYEGIEHNIYYLKPETVNELQNNLTRFYQYAYTLVQNSMQQRPNGQGNSNASSSSGSSRTASFSSPVPVESPQMVSAPSLNNQIIMGSSGSTSGIHISPQILSGQPNLTSPSPQLAPGILNHQQMAQRMLILQNMQNAQKQQQLGVGIPPQQSLSMGSSVAPHVLFSPKSMSRQTVRQRADSNSSMQSFGSPVLASSSLAPQISQPVSVNGDAQVLFQQVQLYRARLNQIQQQVEQMYSALQRDQNILGQQNMTQQNRLQVMQHQSQLTSSLEVALKQQMMLKQQLEQLQQAFILQQQQQQQQQAHIIHQQQQLAFHQQQAAANAAVAAASAANSNKYSSNSSFGDTTSDDVRTFKNGKPKKTTSAQIRKAAKDKEKKGESSIKVEDGNTYATTASGVLPPVNEIPGDHTITSSLLDIGITNEPLASSLSSSFAGTILPAQSNAKANIMPSESGPLPNEDFDNFFNLDYQSPPHSPSKRYIDSSASTSDGADTSSVESDPQSKSCNKRSRDEPLDGDGVGLGLINQLAKADSLLDSLGTGEGPSDSLDKDVYHKSKLIKTEQGPSLSTSATDSYISTPNDDLDRGANTTMSDNVVEAIAVIPSVAEITADLFLKQKQNAGISSAVDDFLVGVSNRDLSDEKGQFDASDLFNIPDKSSVSLGISLNAATPAMVLSETVESELADLEKRFGVKSSVEELSLSPSIESIDKSLRVISQVSSFRLSMQISSRRKYERGEAAESAAADDISFFNDAAFAESQPILENFEILEDGGKVNVAQEIKRRAAALGFGVGGSDLRISRVIEMCVEVSQQKESISNSDSFFDVGLF